MHDGATPAAPWRLNFETVGPFPLLRAWTRMHRVVVRRLGYAAEGEVGSSGVGEGLPPYGLENAGWGN
jgi:hypothetical protein